MSVERAADLPHSHKIRSRYRWMTKVTPSDAFVFSGFQEQMVLGIPSLNVVIARIGFTKTEDDGEIETEGERPYKQGGSSQGDPGGTAAAAAVAAAEKSGKRGRWTTIICCDWSLYQVIHSFKHTIIQCISLTSRPLIRPPGPCKLGTVAIAIQPAAQSL